MSFPNPAFRIARQGVAADQGEWVKHFDPPTVSPPTPELLAPTNPVAEVMAAAGFQSQPAVLHTVELDLMRGIVIPTWETPPLKRLQFFVFGDPSNPAAASGNFPALAVRAPRGVVFHSSSKAFGPPPHTIHWHGLEPTPVNDGVGHCSMEIGQYTYQLQPNFIGTYFYHCHRNTVQHFEFGLYGLFLVEPPDAYFASIASTNPDGSVLLNGIPIGACRDGKLRTAANLARFPQFPGFNPNPLDAPDPWTGSPDLKFATDPHAMTVPYDVEALWVLDDRDSVWSDLAPDPFATFPRHGNTPGVDDRFHERAGANSFFAFNQHNADYWFVTGVPVPAHRGETGTIPANIVVQPALNGGVTGSQVSIDAKVGQTILVRCLDAAYSSTTITFPVDAVIIAWDGRALGVPPFGQYNEPILLPANTPIHISVARRFDALIRATKPIVDFATVKFIDTRGQVPGEPETVLATARIPINIAAAPAGAVFTLSGSVTGQGGTPLAGVTMALTGAASKTVVTNAAGTYTLADLANGNYTVTPSLAGLTFTPASANVTVNGADVAQNFAGSPPTFALSGTLTGQGGAALAGVTMTLTGAASAAVLTDASGNYSFPALANGNYALSPSLAGFAFTPPVTNVTISDAGVAGQNFVGTQTPSAFTLSGTATGQAGAPLAGVTISLTGPVSRTVVTGGAGSYSFTGLANGNYTLTPSLAGFAFTPPATNVTINGADVAGQNFVGGQSASTFTISGTAATQEGAPLAGVTISLAGAVTRTVVTDSAGSYSFTGLANGSYTLTPSLGGFAFTPQTANVTINGADVAGQDFVGAQAPAIFTVSGSVTNQAGAPLAGVTVALTGASSGAALTDAAGNFSFASLANGSYTLTPSRAGFAFSPLSRNVAVSGGNVGARNFVGTQAVSTFAMSGAVTNQAGAPLAGVTMTLSGAAGGTAVTDAAGNYSFAALANGRYTLRPSLGTVPFTPESMDVTVNNGNLTGQNFVGTQPGLGFRSEIFLPFIGKGPIGGF